MIKLPINFIKLLTLAGQLKPDMNNSSRKWKKKTKNIQKLDRIELLKINA